MFKNEKDKNDIENIKSNDSLKDFINENLTESQTEKLKEVLSDENKTRELLNSDLAKQLFKKFTGGDFNGRP
ncbi:MAG: hypothetical protein IKT89_03280 [Clostridia bacterium]|nr:hypothetical protein [Clostridia bacterium]